MRRSLVTCFMTISAMMIIGILSSLNVSAQDARTFSINGTVYEYTQDNDSVPLEFAMVAIPDVGIAATTDADGNYELKGVPKGKTNLKVAYVGKVTIDKTVDVTKSMTICFTLREENFKLKEVMVTAQLTQAGGATSSVIGRNAMDHMQAASLSDVMSLLPGGLASEPSLASVKNVTIRDNGYASSMNSLGTAVIRDGAPMSNNANLSSLSPTNNGASTTNGGGASASTGIDLRSISTDNIESVEVIRGIPSVEHGDLTSGAVIINSKAGREPLRITAKANPKVYMGSVSTGFSLGQNQGAMNLSADYAHNTNNPVESYRSYQRVSARAMYSKEFNRALRSNTSLSFLYGKDQRSLNPDDVDNMRATRGEDYGVTFNTNGLWSIDKGWLKSIRYVASGTYTSKQSYSQSVAVSNNNPFSATLTDGAVLSNTAGQHLFDSEGNEITNFAGADALLNAYCLPANYFQWSHIDSREVNVFAKAVATLFKQSGYINNRILLGLDFRSDGNVGHGKTFDPLGPPQRNVSVPNNTYRSRDYRDIPFLNQLGVFAEENFIWQMGLRELRIQGGVRYDNANRVGGKLSPRLNASFEVLPNKLWIRGGYGVTANMPTMMYLFPEKAYFEYININELSSSKIPDEEKLYVTTTKVHDVDVSNLKIATNRKAEVGIDLKLGQTTFSATAFYEKLRDGYSLGQTFDSFAPFAWTEYTRTNVESPLTATGTHSVLSYWYQPGNNVNSTTRGVEFDLMLGRIEKINTTISLNGAWMRSKGYNSGYVFYDPDNDKGASSRRDIAIYDKCATVTYNENMSTALRVTHNLPRIGFVVTLTAQTVWKSANWGRYGNDSIPVGYMSLQDGKPYFFEEGTFKTVAEFRDSEEYGYMLKAAKHPLLVREKIHPYFCFNMNVTKELGELMRVSFFANNMFRSYPRRLSRRNIGSYNLLNNRFYFGVELQITL